MSGSSKIELALYLSSHQNFQEIILILLLNGMSSFGDLGRFFETAWCTAWPSAPKNKNYIFWTTFDLFVIFY
jgi:hypothetical protein